MKTKYPQRLETKAKQSRAEHELYIPSNQETGTNGLGLHQVTEKESCQPHLNSSIIYFGSEMCLIACGKEAYHYQDISNTIKTLIRSEKWRQEMEVWVDTGKPGKGPGNWVGWRSRRLTHSLVEMRVGGPCTLHALAHHPLLLDGKVRSPTLLGEMGPSAVFPNHTCMASSWHQDPTNGKNVCFIIIIWSNTWVSSQGS